MSDVPKVGESDKHKKAREKIEHLMRLKKYEILSNNEITMDLSFFCMPFLSVMRRFSTRIGYIHDFDIVGILESEIGHNKKIKTITIVEIDGWNTRHGENASKRTRSRQINRDRIAEMVYNTTCEIIKMYNQNEAIEFEPILRVKSEEVLKCKTNEELGKYFIKVRTNSN